MFKIHELREIIQLVNQSSFVDFQFEYEETKILIKKGDSISSTSVAKEGNSIEELASTGVSVPDVSKQREESFMSESKMPVKETIKETSLLKIVSPMVGTFYASPEPGAQAFVQVGDKVTPDTVVCMVEAMKLYNEIEAEVRGEIVEILAENGQIVDCGQALFLVKPE